MKNRWAVLEEVWPMLAMLCLGPLSLIGCEPALERDNPWDPDSDAYVDADGDGYPSQVDCDETSTAIHPDAAELCNGVDDDCANGADDGLTFVLYYTDRDGDSYGVGEGTSRCDGPASGEAERGGDCNDQSSSVHPGVSELCNGADDDCDALIDENLPTDPWYPDEDEDGYGDPDGEVESCTRPSGYVADPGDCDDSDDGIYEGAQELCDGLDNDCDGANDDGLETLDYYVDQDGDGAGAGDPVASCVTLPGHVLTGDDCDDQDSSRFPANPETCDGIDNDCDTTIDEGFPFALGYLDTDEDGYGDPDSGLETCDQTGRVSNPDDCDDLNASVHPGSSEVCDGLDNNCDGDIDEGFTPVTYYLDSDDDGFGDPTSAAQSCELEPPSGYVANNLDCDDRDPDVSPSAIEVCDEKDNDCNGQIDEGFPTSTWYVDSDRDTFGRDDTALVSCLTYANRAQVGGDCNDSDAQIYPGAEELCDGKDNNCNGSIDEGLALTSFYPDADADGYGAVTTAVRACQAPAGYVDNNLDCNDQNAQIHPDAPERFNALDDDCDRQTDEDISLLDAAQRLLTNAGNPYGRQLFPVDLGTGAMSILVQTGSDALSTGAALWDPTRLADADATEQATLMLSEPGGATAAAVGDLDGDGLPDLILSLVGSGGDGSVVVYLGSDITLSGALLSSNGIRFASPDSGDQLGASLRTFDLNADGSDELLVGAPGFDGETGRMLVLGLQLSGLGEASLVLQAEVLGNEGGDLLGTQLEAVGGLVAISGPGADSGMGRVFLVEPQEVAALTPDDPTQIKALTHALLVPPGDTTSRQVRGLGSVLSTSTGLSGGSVTELLVGASTTSGGGAVYVAGVNSSMASQTFDISSMGPHFYGDPSLSIGASVAAIGDINRDGITDLGLPALKVNADLTRTGDYFVIFGGSMSGELSFTAVADASFVVPLTGSSKRLSIAGDDFLDLGVDVLIFGANAYEGAGFDGLMAVVPSPYGGP